MAIALTAWLIAPAPMACTSTRCWVRTTPAMAPATATGLLVAETLRISMGLASPCDDACVGGCFDVIMRLVVIVNRDQESRVWPRCNRYFAYSTLRVSRSTTTLRRPT